jgi:hypothetical protein
MVNFAVPKVLLPKAELQCSYIALFITTRLMVVVVVVVVVVLLGTQTHNVLIEPVILV